MIFEPLLNIEMIIFAVPSIGMVPLSVQAEVCMGASTLKNWGNNAVCSGNKNNAVCQNEKWRDWTSLVQRFVTERFRSKTTCSELVIDFVATNNIRYQSRIPDWVVCCQWNIHMDEWHILVTPKLCLINGLTFGHTTSVQEHGYVTKMILL
jgi:hypothetical protein